MPTPPNIRKYLDAIRANIQSLNESKLFAGILMILLNLGSKYINVHFTPSAEQYFIDHVGRQLVFFAICWMGSRDVYVAVGLTFTFILLNEYLLNYDSQMCIIPQHNRRAITGPSFTQTAPLVKPDPDTPTEADAKQAQQTLDRYNELNKRRLFADTFPYKLV